MWISRFMNSKMNFHTSLVLSAVSKGNTIGQEISQEVLLLLLKTWRLCSTVPWECCSCIRAVFLHSCTYEEDPWQVIVLKISSHLYTLSFLLHLRGKQNSDQKTDLNNFQKEMLEKIISQYIFLMTDIRVLSKQETSCPELLKMFLFRTTRCQAERRIHSAWARVNFILVKGYCKDYESTWGRDVETSSQSLKRLYLQGCVSHQLLKLPLDFSVWCSFWIKALCWKQNLTGLVQLKPTKSLACGS